MTLDEALAAIAARPETRLGTAVAWAAYDAALTAQEAGASSEDVTEIVATFAEAKAALRADLADVSLLL